MKEEQKKCHNCKGKGTVSGSKNPKGTLSGKCLYCRGKGYRSSNYGIDQE